MSKTVIKGLGELRRNLARAAETTKLSAEEAVSQEAENIKDDARRMAPRKTGALRRGIKTDVDGLEARVKSTARHANFVEHGTFKDKAQPYMTPAAALSRRRLPALAARIIGGALERKV